LTSRDAPCDSTAEFAAAGASIAHPLLRVVGLDKAFPGVQAVRAADLEVRAGEVHALVGENGAGKSTLIKVITGAHAPDGGSLWLDGVRFCAAHPLAAARAGIAVIYQEFNLVPGLTVRDNLFLGRDVHRAGIIRTRIEAERAAEIFHRLGAAIDPEALCGGLDLARQQLVEIARALLTDARLLIMDEPTAALTEREAEVLFGALADLRHRGIGMLFISHRLDDIFRVADRVTVMRDGATLGTWPRQELTRARLIELMVGRSLDRKYSRAGIRAEDRADAWLTTGADARADARVAVKGAADDHARGEQDMATGPPLLAVQDLNGARVRGASFEVRRGEILGFAGLVGAGRTELARLVFGADRPRSGRILLNGRSVRFRSPRDAIDYGVCLLTEDRKAEGLVLGLPARDNFALPNLGHWSFGGWIDTRRESAVFERYVKDLRIRLAAAAQPAGQLSGGNQQKLLLARWLECDSQVVIFDEPTRGIDVGAKVEIHHLIKELAAQGKAVILISSELPEILGLSHRILVMHEGRIVGEIVDTASATQQQILQMAVR
jgi:ribose transport system ATP-binding protein